MDQEQLNQVESIFPISNRSEDEQTYFGIINEAMTTEEHRVISNGKPAHAVYLIFKFLECATQSVKIYTGSLKRVLKGNINAYADATVINAAIEFLRKSGTSLSIVIADELDVNEDQSVADHPFVKRIGESKLPGEFSVFQETDKHSDFPEHLLIMDDKAVRVELDPDDTKALVSFGDPELLSLVNKLFDDIKSGCKQLYPA